MKHLFVAMVFIFALGCSEMAEAQDAKTLADTLSIQAEGLYEADPDLATMTFRISAQEKELSRAYAQATGSMQRILQLAERSGLTKQDISTGTFTVFPLYEWRDRKRRARAYRVEATVVLRVGDFSKIGALMDDSVLDGIAEFRSLTYSLADEEGAKQQAVAAAMKRAEGRARAALGKDARLGPLRYISVDVKQPLGIIQVEAPEEPSEGRGVIEFFQMERKVAAPPFPRTSPEKIQVNASVQCVFQLR